MNTITTTSASYTIDDPSEFAFATYNNTGTSGSVGNLVFTSNGETVSIARETITSAECEIPLDRASEDYFCYRLFQDCTNLEKAIISFSGERSTVGTYFCAYMFYGCSALTTLNIDPEYDINISEYLQLPCNGKKLPVSSSNSDEEIIRITVPAGYRGAFIGQWTIADGTRTLQVRQGDAVIQEFAAGTNPSVILIDNTSDLAYQFVLFASGEAQGGMISCDTNTIEYKLYELNRAISDYITLPVAGKASPISSTAENIMTDPTDEEILYVRTPPHSRCFLTGQWTINDGDRTLQILNNGTAYLEYSFGTNPSEITLENNTDAEIIYTFVAKGETTGGIIECATSGFKYEIHENYTLESKPAVVNVEHIDVYSNSDDYVYRSESDHDALVFGQEYGFTITIPAGYTMQLGVWMSVNNSLGESATYEIVSQEGEIKASQTVSTYVEDDYTTAEHYEYEWLNDGENDLVYYLHTIGGTLRLKYMTATCFQTLKYNQFWVSETKSETLTIVGDTSITLPVGCNNTFEVPPFATVTIKGRFRMSSGDYIIDTNGVIYPIDDATELCDMYNNGSYNDSTITFASGGKTVTLARADVRNISLSIPLSSNDYWCAYVCQNMTSLTTTNISFAEGSWAIGNYFCYRMFEGAGSVVIPTSFTPTNVTAIGNYFMAEMFANSGIKNTPDDFCLQLSYNTDITSVGDYFLYRTFYDCTALESIGNNFIAQSFYSCKLETVGVSFLQETFSGCSSLAITGNNCLFRVFQGASTSTSYLTTIGDNLFYNLWEGCDNLTEVGVTFYGHIFRFCSKLSVIPETFNLPQTLVKTGRAFLQETFESCSSLTEIPDFTIPQTLTTIANAFLDTTFYGCSLITKIPDGCVMPLYIDYDNCNFAEWFWDCFNGCTSLQTMPDNFRLPRRVNGTEDSNTCIRMFNNCSSLQSGENVVLTFPCTGTNAFSGTSFTPTSPSAGDTYYIKGNNE